MPKIDENGQSGDEEIPHGGSSWWRRKTFRQLVRDEETREPKFRGVPPAGLYQVPVDESMGLCGISVVEIYTSSTFASLEKSIAKILANNPIDRMQLLQILREGSWRSTVGGWRDLGSFVPKVLTLGDIQTILPSMPTGVKAMSLYAHMMTPSVTAIVATFALDEANGDMTEILQKARSVEHSVSIEPHGRYSNILKKVPLYKPQSWSTIRHTSNESDSLGRDASQFIETIESEILEWFYSTFKGAFSRLPREDVPSVRLLLTEKNAPFENYLYWAVPLDLHQLDNFTWESDESGLHWKIRANLHRNGKSYWVAAARRSQFPINKYTQDQGNVPLALEFQASNSQLVALWYLGCLVRVYSVRVHRFRDDAAVRKPFLGPISRAKRLDKFLLGEGLDASSIAHDLRKFSEFRTLLTGFTKYRTIDSKSKETNKERRDLGSILWDSVEASSSELEQDTEVTLANIRASADLQQAIANTRLQWVVLLLSVLAIVITLIM